MITPVKSGIIFLTGLLGDGNELAFFRQDTILTAMR